MYLFRGLNERDYSLYCSGKDILCNLSRYNGYPGIFRTIRREIITKDLSVCLDRIIGHVSGNNVKFSCWISSSSDYNYVTREYCIPQSGRYNIDRQRKNIIVIDTNNEIDKNIDRYSTNTGEYIGYYINLSNNNLSKYVNDGFIGPLSLNINSYYCPKSSKVNLDDPNVDGFSNFATGANEYLFLISIKQEDIKYLINPLMQDIIYSYTYGLNDNQLINDIIDFCMLNEDLINENINNNTYNFTNEEINLIKYLYIEENDKYNNVIDYVVKNYDNSHDIVNDYEVAKNIKRSILSKITGLNNIYLVDDSIYVINDELNNKGILVNNRKITKKNKNDIVCVTDEYGNLEKGNSKVKTIGKK